MSERLAKFIARSGVCSRRAAEELILQKRITVNGDCLLYTSDAADEL